MKTHQSHYRDYFNSLPVSVSDQLLHGTQEPAGVKVFSEARRPEHMTPVLRDNELYTSSESSKDRQVC